MTVLTGALAAALILLTLYVVADKRAVRRVAEVTDFDEGEVMVCRRPPKGWICTMNREHEGVCDTVRERQPVHFLRRNERGKLERLVSSADGKWVGWVSAERGTRGWVIWQAIAKARGI